MVNRRRTINVAAGWRILKWVGDPPALREDGITVANWKWENGRSYPVLTAPPGQVIRFLPKSYKGLTKDYCWGTHAGSREYLEVVERYVTVDPACVNFCIPVLERDAIIILTNAPHEFRDVTDVANPDLVRSTPIIFDNYGRRVQSGIVLNRERLYS